MLPLVPMATHHCFSSCQQLSLGFFVITESSLLFFVLHWISSFIIYGHLSLDTKWLFKSKVNYTNKAVLYRYLLSLHYCVINRSHDSVLHFSHKRGCISLIYFYVCSANYEARILFARYHNVCPALQVLQAACLCSFVGIDLNWLALNKVFAATS